MKVKTPDMPGTVSQYLQEPISGLGRIPLQEYHGRGEREVGDPIQ